jgi:hypothetical protein
MMGEKKGLKGFQNELYSIRKWNNNIVSDEYKKIVKYTKCKYLANLIKIIIITTIKIKIYMTGIIAYCILSYYLRL